ncbi:preprotein translocase subunit SecA [Rhodococcus sp. WMMA185]|nr:preprotein translocase subunit SecA [Rhodococcus sp. WMMA185]
MAQRRAERESAAAAVTRPFQGLAAECDLVALREFVPSATAPLPLKDSQRQVTLATVLPGAVAALVREEGDDATGFVGVQVQVHSADLGADLAASIVWAQESAPGESLTFADPGSETPALADVIDADALLDITVHQDFDWWIPEGVEPTSEVAATVQHANAAIMPSARIEADGIVGAWWVDAGERAHLRWVRPEDEDDLMLALARVHAAGGLHLGEGSRYAGSFRTHGLLVPVFDLDREKHPTEWAAGTIELGERLTQALAVDAPLTNEERRARDGLRGRQVTLR